MIKNAKTTVIEPQRSPFALGLNELYEFRDLLWALVWRYLKIRYKQTVIGVAWVWFQPMIMMMVYSIFFGYFARFPSGEFPYPLFVLTGIIPWLFLSRSISEASNSLIENRTMLTRLYFPRLILPLTAVVGTFIDMLVALVVLALAMVYFGHVPGSNIVFLPIFVFELIVLAAGLSILTAGLNAIYRDFGFIVPILLQVWLFSSPIVYARELLPEAYRLLYGLNPLVGILEGIRWSLGGAAAPYLMTDQIVTVGVTFTVLVFGVGYFRMVERTLVDKL